MCAEAASCLRVSRAFGRSGAGCCLEPESAGAGAGVFAAGSLCVAAFWLLAATGRSAELAPPGSAELAGAATAAAAAPGLATGSAGSAASSEALGARVVTEAGTAAAGLRENTDTGG